MQNILTTVDYKTLSSTPENCENSASVVSFISSLERKNLISKYILQFFPSAQISLGNYNQSGIPCTKNLKLLKHIRIYYLYFALIIINSSIGWTTPIKFLRPTQVKVFPKSYIFLDIYARIGNLYKFATHSQFFRLDR